MALNPRHIKLAQSLPPQLARFFARYPPQAIIDPTAEQSQSSDSNLIASNTAHSDAIARTPENFSEISPPSPFQSYKNPLTGKWRDPVYSLRRQADLLKLARQHGVEELMPFSVKSMAERVRRREENGLRVKGTGVGQKVKGKESERTMKTRLEKRRQAMLEMPQMIQTWKERGHGRGWKKWPK